MPSGSATQRLADTLLGEPVIDWLRVRRAAGTPEKRSFRQLASELADATDRQVDVTDQTIADWLAERDLEAAS